MKAEENGDNAAEKEHRATTEEKGVDGLQSRKRKPNEEYSTEQSMTRQDNHRLKEKPGT